ncbi:MAG: hypothetical protein MZU79_00865 [Anaerotruncus sp.]|nr:hypothetical protein [Anaerotruncus sp.]
MRLDISTVGDRVLIDDAYHNANLLSMTAALEVLAGVAASGRRIAVLADMLELGPIEAETHRELGRQVPKWGVDLLVCVGPASRATAQVAISEGMAAEAVFWTDDRQVAADYVLRNAPARRRHPGQGLARHGDGARRPGSAAGGGRRERFGLELPRRGVGCLCCGCCLLEQPGYPVVAATEDRPASAR